MRLAIWKIYAGKMRKIFAFNNIKIRQKTIFQLSIPETLSGRKVNLQIQKYTKHTKQCKNLRKKERQKQN